MNYIISERLLGKLFIKYPSQPHLSEEIQLRRVQYSFGAGSTGSRYCSYLMQRAARGEPDSQLAHAECRCAHHNPAGFAVAQGLSAARLNSQALRMS